MANQNLIVLLGGLFGIVFHALMSVRSMNKMLPKETFSSVFKAYLQTDMASLITSVLTVLFLIYLLAGNLPQPDQPDKTGDFQDWMLYYFLKNLRFGSAVAGYFGDSIVYAIMGRVGKRLAEKDLNVTTNNP